jgi:RND family efflux transporter MFP subunit
MKPRSTPRLSFALMSLALIALIALIACQQQEAPALPPATGKGAPARAPIPSLADLAKSAPVAPPSVTMRAGTGSLRPIREASLGPKQTGVLSAIMVEEGDRVKKGQLLFRQDSAQAQLSIESARAAVSAAKLQLAQAQLDHDRTKTLRERGSVPQDALDQTKTRVDALSNAVEQSETALALAQKYSNDLAVTSPIDGLVASKLMNVGETATLMPPSVVLLIQEVDTLELRARLPETALRTVHVGHELSVSFPATGETRDATIKRIAPTIDARTRTIEIIAELPNADGRLKAGMMAEVAYGSPEAAATPTPAPANGAPKMAAKAKPEGDHEAR